MGIFDAVGAAVAGSGRRHRRSWASRGRAHIEVRGLRPGSDPRLIDDLKRALDRLEAVRWAEVNAVLGRVVVAFDDGVLGLDDLVGIVEGVEQAADVAGDRFPFDRPEHPADAEPIRRTVVALAADAVGVAGSLFGTALRASPIPVEAASVVTVLESEPHVRRFLENHVGPTVTDLGLAVANATAQALAQGPLGLVVDMAHRAGILTEAQARRRTWEAREPTLAPATRHPLPDERLEPRALPPGPVEHYVNRASMASLAAFGITLATTANPRRAAAALMAGIPKSARLGREAFAAHVGRVLARRNVLVLDNAALRCLDRVDCVVIDERAMDATERVISHVEIVGEADPLAAHRVLREVFDGGQALVVRHHGRWTIGPVDDVAPDEVPPIDRPGPTPTHALLHDGRLVARFAVTEQDGVIARGLVDAARRAGHMVAVASGDGRMASRLRADLTVAGGANLADSVRTLQDDGCVVLLVAGPDPSAHGVADVSVGTVADDGSVPWSADVVCAADLRDAVFMVEATTVAHEVSRQSAALALAGSSVGSILVLTSPVSRAGSRAMTSVNVAALLAIANGLRAGITLDRRERGDVKVPPRWHELETDEVLDALRTSARGLTGREASRRLPPAETAAPAAVAFARNVFEELANPLTPVLAAGAALSAAVGSMTDATMVGGVQALNSVLGAAQRFRAERAIRALSVASAPPVTVRRNGRVTTVSADRIVAGDVITLEAGDVVPADCRVLSALALEVDEASLTGESDLVTKSADPSFAPLVAERTSMLYEGTTVAAGSATAVVVATGEDTEAGAAAAVRGQRPAPVGGVEARLGHLATVSLPFALGGGGAVLGSGLLRGVPIEQSVGSAVSLTVAAVPEGLPLVATLAQLAAARRLSARGALVRNPRAVEALGRVDVICTDKTGTLTEGRIRVRSVSDGRQEARLRSLPPYHAFVLAVAVRASPATNGHGPVPHPTDAAVLAAGTEADVPATAAATGWQRITELPFEPARGYHATLGETESGRLLSVKGAPEVVLPRCDRWRTVSGERRLSSTDRDRVNRRVERLARRGLRVLAVAERQVAGEGELSDAAVDGLVLVGLLALADPVRREAAESVSRLREAGVDIVMVTGDHPSTAEGIAAELGILNGGRVVTGTQVDDMADEELDALVPHVSVFARVTPAHKVRIVTAFQRAGRAVAMTGDGANDAPAIRLADVGVALGARSTAAARHAADVVITDDRVETIIDAVTEGRAMWASVRDAVAILLGGNLGEIAFTVAGSAVSGRAPLSPRQLLLVNVLTDVAPAIAIASRPPPRRSPAELLAEGPDRSLGRALEQAIVARALTTAAGASAAWLLASVSGPPKRASTIALVSLVGTQLGQTLVTGGRDPAAVAAVVVSAAILGGIVATPGVSQFFGCTPLDPIGWTIGVGTATAATAAGVVAPPFARAIRSSLTIPRVRLPGRDDRRAWPLPIRQVAVNALPAPASE